MTLSRQTFYRRLFKFVEIFHDDFIGIQCFTLSLISLFCLYIDFSFILLPFFLHSLLFFLMFLFLSFLIPFFLHLYFFFFPHIFYLFPFFFLSFLMSLFAFSLSFSDFIAKKWVDLIQQTVCLCVAAPVARQQSFLSLTEWRNFSDIDFTDVLSAQGWMFSVKMGKRRFNLLNSELSLIVNN